MSTAAYAIDGSAVTASGFYAAACDPARSVIVEACAGAGKTWMLVSRILRALLAGAQPHEILAITFTKKAAGEMRARLDEWLTEFGSPDCSDERRAAELRARGIADGEARALAPTLAALHERLLRGGRSVEVRTFHAWFSQLLRAAPLDLLAEQGLQPDMELVEDPVDHRPEVYRRFHAAVLDDAALRDDFERQVRDRGRQSVRRWLDTAWEKRVEIELADAAGTLEGSVAAAAGGRPLQRLDAGPVRVLLADVATALCRHEKATPRKQGALFEDALAIADPAARLAALRAALLTKGRLRVGLDVPGIDDAVAILDEIESDALQQAAHEEHLRMVRLARVLFAEYAAYKRSRGLADMADLERGALAVLRDAPLAGWVQERLDARVRHLLIDEFQDTSPLQWHALHAWLAGYVGAGGGASGQRPPGIFIVGDPKQSIYRFRGAEPRVFAAARDFVVEGLGGSLLTCDHTRRNAPAVLAALNGVFAQAQADGDYAGFRPHTTDVETAAGAGVFALPCVMRSETATVSADVDAAAWRDTLATPRQEPDELLREREAGCVADAIAALIRHDGIAPSGIHVLCRKRESLRLVAQALAARHLPFAAPEDFELIDAPEVRDLAALLDMLASPSHRLPLAHALRSPVFGASDDDLIAIARAAGPSGDWWHALRELPAPGERLLRARELLARWRRAALRLPPHDLLDLIVADGEVRERYVAAVPPERRAAALGAIDALLQQTLTLDGARYATPYNFVRSLKRRVLKVPAALQSAAVQLLTVHGAKGLEADVVFVMDADPNPKGGETATLLVDWPVESEHPRHCAFVYSESRCPVSLRAVLERELQAREREELNGLYVAMTRARERLVFSATQPRRVQPSWWTRITPWVRPWSAPTDAGHAAATAPPAVLPRLPAWRGAAGASAARTGVPDDALASRLGQAVHRVLEWAAVVADPDLERLAQAAAGEFRVDAREVARLAGRIWRSPDCRRFFAGPQLRWSGNEVPVSEGGEVLRIDRLVALDEGGTRAWWVLDYKLQHAPEALPAYREQLSRYRLAVQALQPGEPVHGAFITGAGEVIELD
jgi:ATP-dependent helicase/nuclease subunit A